jgi:uracil-DNA glycosylase
MAGISTPKRDASHLSEPVVDTKKPKVNNTITSFFGAPKSKPVQSTRFDKGRWVASLTAEQKDLLKLEIETLDESWLAYLKDVIVTKEFLSLKRFLKSEKESGATIFPPEKDVYSWYGLYPWACFEAVLT